MSRPLCDAVLRVQRRRLRAAAARHPLPLALVALAWLAAPVAAWRLGSSLGEALAPALADVSSARALVLGLGLACASLGAAIGVSLPPPGALGDQVVAAPVSRRALALAVTLPVAVGVSAFVGPIVVALVVSFAGAAPGGGVASALLLVSLTSATGAGALLSEAALHLVARRLEIAAIAAGVMGLALAALSVEAGGRGLTEGAAAAPFGVAAAVALLVCAHVWLGLVAARPARASRRRGRPLLAPPRRRAAAVAASAVALLVRPNELRMTLIAATGFGLVGLAVAASTGAPPAAGLLLGGGSCAVAACLVPLSVRGRIDPGTWVWRTAGRTFVATSWAGAALALVVAAVLPVCLVALARGPEAAPAALQVAGLAVFAWAGAVAAGAVVPRRACGAGDDALSLATLAAVTVGLGAATAAAGSHLAATGVPDAAAGCLILAMVSLGAVGVLAAMWGSR